MIDGGRNDCPDCGGTGKQRDRLVKLSEVVAFIEGENRHQLGTWRSYGRRLVEKILREFGGDE